MQNFDRLRATSLVHPSRNALIRRVILAAILFGGGALTTASMLPRTANADYGYWSSNPYLKATAGNVKAYRATKAELGNWITSFGFKTLPVDYMQSSIDIVNTSYTFDLQKFERADLDWGEDDHPGFSTFTYYNTPAFPEYDYYDYIDTQYDVTLTTTQCYSADACYLFTGYGAYNTITVAYGSNSPSTTGSGTPTTYP